MVLALLPAYKAVAQQRECLRSSYLATAVYARFIIPFFQHSQIDTEILNLTEYQYEPKWCCYIEEIFSTKAACGKQISSLLQVGKRITMATVYFLDQRITFELNF
jgi:hypothetical protein